MSREQLGIMLGVSAQTVGSWERLGQKHLAENVPRESEATRRAKKKLPMAMRFMEAASILCLPCSELTPAPHDWLPLINEGDPLVLVDDVAVEGDLVLLRDAAGELSTVARVAVEREAGQMMCFVRPYRLMRLPGPDGYKVIGHCIHKLHTGIPETSEWEQRIPPYVI